jgi:hypothetical protein
MFSIKKNKTTSTLWHVLIPMSGVTLLASATGGMSGDIFNLLVTQELGYTPSVLSLVYIGMLFSFPIQLFGPGIARRFTFRKLMLFGNFVSGLSIIAIVLAAQLNISSEIRVVIIVSSAIIVEIAYSLSYGTVWFTWVGDVVDRNDRSIGNGIWKSTVARLSCYLFFDSNYFIRWCGYTYILFNGFWLAFAVFAGLFNSVFSIT